MGFSNTLRVLITGDTKGLERSFARANQATTTFGRNVDSTGAKVDKTAKKMSGFARGAATGFGGAIALNATIEGIRSVAEAAAESQQVLGQTRVALETTGKSWAEYGAVIEDTVKTQSKLGFDDEALLRTFQLFVRTTGEVSEALRLNNLAMDVARGRYIDLEQAAQLVNKAAIGQGGALRRLGIDVAANATRTELLTALTEKYGGAAQAASGDASTAFQRTQVATENLKESIGTLLLPALELLAANMQQAAEFATNLTDALNRLGSVTIPEIEIPFNIKIGGQTVGDLSVKAFSAAKFIGPFLPIAVANLIAQEFRDGAESPAVENKLANEFARSINTLTTNALDTAAKQASKTKTKVAAFGQKGFKALPENTLGEDLERQFNATLDALNLKLDKTAVTKTGKDDLAVLAELEKVIRERIKSHGRTTDLLRLLFQVDQQRATVLQGEATAAADAREETKRRLAELTEQRKEIARLAQEARQASEFKRIGLSATGGDIIPGLDNLRKQFSALSKNVVGQDVPKKLRDRLALVGKFLRSGIKSAEEPTRAAIRDLFNMIRDEFDQGTKEGPLTKTSALNSNKILEGLGLGRDTEKEIRARLSSFNSAGQQLSGSKRPTGNFASGNVVVENHNTVNLDGETVGRNVTRSQQKSRRRNSVQKRGPRSGV